MARTFDGTVEAYVAPIAKTVKVRNHTAGTAFTAENVNDLYTTMVDAAEKHGVTVSVFAPDIEKGRKGGFSVAELLDGQLVNQKGDALADVENISFNGAKAETLILGFNEVLGMGGQKAAMSFSAAQLIKNADGGGYDFQLNASQTKQFESYKNQF